MAGWNGGDAARNWRGEVSIIYCVLRLMYTLGQGNRHYKNAMFQIKNCIMQSYRDTMYTPDICIYICSLSNFSL